MPGKTGTEGNAKSAATRLLNELKWRDRALYLQTRGRRTSEEGARLHEEVVFAVRGSDAHDFWLTIRREAVRLGLGHLLDAPLHDDTLFSRTLSDDEINSE